MSSPAKDPEPRLVHIGETRFNLGEVSTGTDTPRGKFIFCPVTGGHFHTVHPLPSGIGIHSDAVEGLRAEVLSGGGDYPLIHEDRLAELNVNVVAKGLNNDHLFRITSFGVCEWNSLVFNMLRQTPDARSTEMGEVNAWQVFRINTSSPEYAWLNWSCLIGQEKLLYEGGRMAATHMKLYQFLVQ